MRRLALIDGDIVAYKIAAVSQQDDGFSAREGDKRAITLDPEKARRELNAYVNDLADLCRADEVLVCLSDPARNWRKEYWKGYKANRDPSRRPLLLQFVKEAAAEEWPTKIVTALEADDVMGIAATAPGFRPECEKVIVSEDKDLRGIPGLLFNPAKDKRPQRISELDADRFFMWQAVVGDTSDGYPGVPGIGPKSKLAAAILSADSAEAAWESVLDAYESRPAFLAQIGAEPNRDGAALAALFQCRLARILRHADYNYRLRCPRYWAPPDPGRPYLRDGGHPGFAPR